MKQTSFMRYVIGNTETLTMPLNLKNYFQSNRIASHKLNSRMYLHGNLNTI